MTSCGTPTKKSAEQNIAQSESSSAEQHNVLTEEEAANGWKLLFDGTSFNGWRTYKDAEQNSWEIENGSLHCKPFSDSGPNSRADLITVEQFDNFELRFEWRVAPQGNTGVIYRVTERYDQPYQSGPEFQLIDDKGYPGDLKDWQRTGACYDMYAPSAVAVNPPGEWNTGKIIARGNDIEHWVNGTKVVSYQLHSPQWTQRKNEGKWKDAEGYGLTEKGHIDLQDHQMEAWFRNIKIRNL